MGFLAMRRREAPARCYLLRARGARRGYLRGSVLLDPGGVLGRRLDDDAAGHQAMADAAHLRALDVVDAGLGRFPPAGDHTTGNRVLLEAEHRHAEAVHHVPGLEVEVVDLVD